jgi:hypothetical protein
LLLSLSTVSLNLAITGIMSLTGTLGPSDALNAFSASEKPAVVVEVKEVVFRETQPVITADGTVKLDFSRSAVTTVAAPPKVDPLIAVMSADPEAQASKNFDVVATIKAAQSEIGKSFPTGWSQPGECIMSAKRWIAVGKGNWYGAGTPIGNYAGAKEVEFKNAAPGDVIQYLSPTSPESWVAGVHTVLVTKNNGDGTLQIIEANNPGGSGLVSENKKWTPKPPNGTVFKVFRF